MRRRLVLVALATTTMVAVALCVPLLVLVRDVAERRAVRDAELDARAVVLAVAADRDNPSAAVGSTGAGRAGRVTIFLPDGSSVGGTERDDDPEAVDVGRTQATTLDVSGGRAVVAPLVSAGGVSVVRVYVPDSLLRQGVVGASVAIVTLAVVLVLVAVIVADRLARSIRRPVDDLAGAAARLGSGDLATRVMPSGPPELEAVGTAFNHLAGRVNELLADERELVADLSHRLRTPLTALRLDAERIEDPETAERVQADVAAVQRTVDDLIHEARRSRRDRTTTATCDAAAVVRDRTAFWAVLAEDQDRPCAVIGVEPADGVALVPVAPDDLAAALDALLGNVFAHTPDGTGFRVRVERTATGDRRHVVIVVDDDGPGFTSPRVLRRGESSGGSTGLGLDIARRTAEDAGGTASVSTHEGGGGRVALVLPAA